MVVTIKMKDLIVIKRRKTRQIKVGGVKIGGGAPVSIQSMTNTVTSDVRSTISQIKRLETAGCEIARVAVKSFEDAEAIRAIKRSANIPVVADIHFDYRLALRAIKSGADKIRINPGNMRDANEVAEVVKAARNARIPIRIGVNSGSAGKSSQFSVLSSQTLVRSAMKYIRLFEKMKFHDIIISLKSSDVHSTVEAYRKISGLCDYPLHLGVTAAGPYDPGIVKSSIGIGSLLLDGIGDTIRVSLTADPVEEVAAAKRILQAVGVRRFGPDIISCPTCGRCQVNLIAIVNDLESKLSTMDYGPWTKSALSIAVMGCEVNGPGEAREADIGVAAGKRSGVLFKKGKIIKRIHEKDFVKEILKIIKLRTGN